MMVPAQKNQIQRVIDFHYSRLVRKLGYRFLVADLDTHIIPANDAFTGSTVSGNYTFGMIPNFLIRVTAFIIFSFFFDLP